MLFEDLGFRYIGPIDGHNIALLRKYLQMVRKMKDPVLLHVVTEKGRGFRPAEADPGLLSYAAVFVEEDGKAILKVGGSRRLHGLCARRHGRQMRGDPRVCT